MADRDILSLTEGRKRIFELADRVQDGESYITLTEHGHPKVVLMSAAMFDRWQAAVGLSNKREQVYLQDTSRTVTAFRSLEKILESQGLIIADKAKEQYDPSGSPHKRGNTTDTPTSRR